MPFITKWYSTLLATIKNRKKNITGVLFQRKRKISGLFEYTNSTAQVNTKALNSTEFSNIKLTILSQETEAML